MVASGIGVIVFILAATIIFFSARSFAALTNYVDLDRVSRNALDTMSTEIRQVDTLTSFATNKVVFRGTEPVSAATYILSYTYDPSTKTLTSEFTGARREKKVLLSECQDFLFASFQRNPINGSYDQYPTDPNRPDLCKLIQVSWVCSRNILGKKANTESVQSAKFVIRKQ
jgi:hypothetical protein